MSAWSKVVSPSSTQPSIQRTRSATGKFQSPMRQAPATMRERVGPPGAVTIMGAWSMCRNSVGQREILTYAASERRMHSRRQAPLRFQLHPVDPLVDGHLPEHVDAGLLAHAERGARAEVHERRARVGRVGLAAGLALLDAGVELHLRHQRAKAVPAHAGGEVGAEARLE